MQVHLTKKFNEKQREFINYYLAEIINDSNLSIDSVFINHKNLLDFLSCLLFPNYSDNEQMHLSLEDQNTLAENLIACIVDDEQAFIEIIMAESSVLSSLAVYPSLQTSMALLMGKMLMILESKKTVREKFIDSLMDIDRITRVRPGSNQDFLNILINNNELERFLKSNHQLCEEIKRFPHLSNFFINSALQSDVLFHSLFSTQVDLLNLKKTLATFGFVLEESAQKAVSERIFSKQVEDDELSPRFGTFFAETNFSLSLRKKTDDLIQPLIIQQN